MLREGTVLLRVEGERERLLSIRRGELPWDEVNAWRLVLHREFDAARPSPPPTCPTIPTMSAPTPS